MSFLLTGIVLLLSGAVLSLAVPGNRRRAWMSILTQALASAFVLAAVIPVLFGAPPLQGELFWSYPVERVGLRIDALSAFFLTFSMPLTALGSVYALGYLQPYFEKKRHAGLHFAILNLISLSYLIVYSVENAIVFLLGWEIAALSAWLAVIWDYKNQKVRFAGFNYLVSTHLSFLFLIAGFMIMHSTTGAFDFQGFRLFLREPGTLRGITFLLLMTSFGLKSAFFPFHTWLPRAHSAAPAHVSALMSGVIHKAGIYGILRFIALIGRPEPWMGESILVFSTLSAGVGALYTASQRDLKRLLGYSSTENVGIAGIGIGIGCLGLAWNNGVLAAIGFAGAILHVLNHALFKCLLFYAAGTVYRMTHSIDLEKLGGLIKKMPMTAGFFLIGGLAISALPPFNGFVSEFLIYSGLLHPNVPDAGGRGLLIAETAALALVGAISALSMTRAFGIAFLGSARSPSVQFHPIGKWEAPRSMLLTMGAHALGVTLLGLAPAIGLKLVAAPASLFLPESPAAGPGLLALLLSPISKASLAFLAVLGALLFLRKVILPSRARKHVTWGCGYTQANPRMQYSGSSFSEPFLSVFRLILRVYRRESLPTSDFPRPAYLNTHYVDAVERRMFKVLGEGEALMLRIKRRLLREDSLTSFWLGLLGLMALVAIAVVTATKR